MSWKDILVGEEAENRDDGACACNRRLIMKQRKRTDPEEELYDSYKSRVVKLLHAGFLWLSLFTRSVCHDLMKPIKQAGLIFFPITRTPSFRNTYNNCHIYIHSYIRHLLFTKVQIFNVPARCLCFLHSSLTFRLIFLFHWFVVSIISSLKEEWRIINETKHQALREFQVLFPF